MVSLQTSVRCHFFWERSLQTPDCAQSPWVTEPLIPPYLKTESLFLLVIPCPTLLRALPSAPSSQDTLPPPPVASRPYIVSVPALSSHLSPAVSCAQAFPLAFPSSVALLLCRSGPSVSSVRREPIVSAASPFSTSASALAVQHAPGQRAGAGEMSIF